VNVLAGVAKSAAVWLSRSSRRNVQFARGQLDAHVERQAFGSHEGLVQRLGQQGGARERLIDADTAQPRRVGP
jgi:hypothetical protein